MEREVTEEKIERYVNVTKKALSKAKKSMDRKDFKNLSAKAKRDAKALYDMAERYYHDSMYFKNKKMLVTAFAAINYAHGWLDSGSKLGLFMVKDNKLFVIR